jgi:phage-related protein
MKKLMWLGGTRKRLRDFPDEARREAGEQLWRVQCGAEPLDWRPMPSIGTGAIEIRIHRPHEHRVVYVATHPEGIYVLHAFEKKTRQTPQRDIERAKASYAEIQQQRAKSGQ